MKWAFVLLFELQCAGVIHAQRALPDAFDHFRISSDSVWINDLLELGYTEVPNEPDPFTKLVADGRTWAARADTIVTLDRTYRSLTLLTEDTAKFTAFVTFCRKKFRRLRMSGTLYDGNGSDLTYRCGTRRRSFWLRRYEDRGNGAMQVEITVCRP